MNIRPLHDRVVVKRTEEEKVSAGGIMIPDSAADKPSQGKIVAAGKGKLLDNGVWVPLSVKAGDRVLFGKYAGSEIRLGDEKFLVMREDEIMAVLE
ncbi:MAG: co-chaperone GroES [Gammaproteobacteria bacterium]